jgi:glutamyl-tRNA reductase
MPELLCIGISHKTAPLALRERLALNEPRAHELMRDLVGEPEVSELVALNTCNRTELHIVTSDAVAAESIALGRLAQHAHIPPTELVDYLYTKHAIAALRHLLRVAGGLESMVLGEHEILGQVKRAHQAAMEADASGPVCNRLFASASITGKRIRSETAIGAGRLSVATTAVDVAGDVLGELSGKQALIVGTGGNGELMARAFGAAQVSSVFIANRHYDRAIGVAQRVGGRALRFEHLPEELLQTDIVIGATGSPHALLHREELREVMARRRGHPLLIIDTALPRDVEPEVSELADVTLLDLDDLQQRVEQVASVRRSETEAAEAIVAQELEAFWQWLGTIDALPAIAELRRRGNAIAERAVEENARHFKEQGDLGRRRLELMAESIVTRLLHEPTLRLKQSAGSAEGSAQLAALRELFALGEDPPAGPDGEEPTASEDEEQRRAR